MKHTYLIISLSLFFVTQLKSQTTNPLDTLTLVNGWKLVEYAPGVYYAKTYFDKTSAYHGNYSQWFVVDRPSPNVADPNKYYATFKKNLPKRIKKDAQFFNFYHNYAHSTPNSGIEQPTMQVAFGWNNTISNFQDIIISKNDFWTRFFIPLNSSDSIDCIYLRISGNFLRTYIQIDYLAFVNEMYEIKYLIDDFEDATIVDKSSAALDTLTTINGWKLREYTSNITYVKTYYDQISKSQGKYSQWFIVHRISPEVAEDGKYYALFKKNLSKRIKKTDYLKFYCGNSYSAPNTGVEKPRVDIAFGNKGKESLFQNILNKEKVTMYGWDKYTINVSGLLLDSIDCVYLKVSGNNKNTSIQLDNFVFIDPIDGTDKDIIDDFEDATIVDVEETPEIPTTFSLSQNYPNPFNPSTSIEFRISKFEHVNLKIFNLLGREIETLVDEYKQAGTYNSKFSIRNSQLPSGVYFYRLRAGKYSETKKMILLR